MATPCIHMMGRDFCRYEPGGSELNCYVRSMPAALLIVLSFALIFTAGCRRDETPTDTAIPSSIDVSGIYLNRSRRHPYDSEFRGPRRGKVLLRYISGKSKPERSCPTRSWAWEAIERIDSTSITIRWKVPAEAGKYMVTVRARAGSEVTRIRHGLWAALRCERRGSNTRSTRICRGRSLLRGHEQQSHRPQLSRYHAYKPTTCPPLDRQHCGDSPLAAHNH